MMNEWNNSNFYLDGNLDLELDNNKIKVSCEGYSIKLTFTSFTALRKFFTFYRHFKETILANFTKKHTDYLQISYYLNSILVAESHSGLQPSWAGRYLGIEKTKIYPMQFLSYFFKS